MILIMASNTVRHFIQCSECKEMFRARLSLRLRARNRLVGRAVPTRREYFPVGSRLPSMATDGRHNPTGQPVLQSSVLLMMLLTIVILGAGRGSRVQVGIAC